MLRRTKRHLLNTSLFARVFAKRWRTTQLLHSGGLSRIFKHVLLTGLNVLCVEQMLCAILVKTRDMPRFSKMCVNPNFNAPFQPTVFFGVYRKWSKWGVWKQADIFHVDRLLYLWQWIPPDQHPAGGTMRCSLCTMQLWSWGRNKGIQPHSMWCGGGGG